MKERYKVRAAVYLFLVRNNPENELEKQILLQKRQNTGYMDNMYDACASGHLDPNESILEAIQREAKEEICLDIDREDLQLVTTYHCSTKYNKNEAEYLKFYFSAKRWNNEPKIGESEKCSELIWADIKNLPENTIEFLRVAISNYLKGIPYGQDEF